MASFPKRGDVYIAEIDPVSGQSSETPVVIIQNNVGNEFSSFVICAKIETESEPSFDLEIFLASDESGLDADGIVRADILMTLNKNRLGSRTGRLSPATLSNLDTGISISLGLEEV